MKRGAGGSSFHIGGDGGIRTHDLRVANAALSQLSYTPVFDYRLLMRHTDTSQPGILKNNPRPPRCERGALPTELHPRIGCFTVVPQDSLNSIAQSGINVNIFFLTK